MKYEFAVACACHCSGAGIQYIGKERFSTHKAAQNYADKIDDCIPTIYIIIDDKYVFYCHPYHPSVWLAKNDVVPWVYSIQPTPWGEIETRIWWRELIKNPQAFYHLAVGEINT